ncbi:protein kinase-like protein [Salsuginibacillus halophilus]|uniref:Protein kinase-like protein n=1 Tax=Salsuginibacillus halophilus TaxID=517424 RepID=A0A2P8HBI4_9BACI|nr:protein kinase [Salsuginibacillus halophilus]PSL43585.1 protein kinase-like protein [Salsuginibacillus halophilus]
MIQQGHEVVSAISGEKITVGRKLGEGGQGRVFTGRRPDGTNVAVKWYNDVQATPDQKRGLLHLLKHGRPSGAAGARFVWPIDLVEHQADPCFGYVMDVIDMKRFAELGEVWAGIKPAPSFRAMARISAKAAESYRKLHLDGFCYRDISSGNLLFDPTAGDVLICDNDNVGINGQSTAQVLGTMEYMAPEIVRGEAVPGTKTDLHSLAVLLFQLWIWHHPFHGRMEYDIRSWDLPAKKRVYGETPVFIFDEDDHRNELPDDPEYDTAKLRWSVCPKPLKRMFRRVFIEGVERPEARPMEGEWQKLFRQLEDSVVTCPSDRAENIWDGESSEVVCWHCRQTFPLPPKLIFKQGSSLMLDSTAKLRYRHVQAVDEASGGDQTAGEIVQNPKKPDIWGLKNLTDVSWRMQKQDGTVREVPPGQAATLSHGMNLTFNDGATAYVTS